MQRLVLKGAGEVAWEDVAEPTLPSDDAAIVRPLTLATCDLDVAVLQGRYPLEGPYPFGHEGVAEVVEVGAAVTTVTPGDRVIVPFQISCGRCVPCRRGRTGNCAAHPPMTTYGLGPLGGLDWGGLAADLAAVPHADAMLVALPDGVAPTTAASCSDNVPDAWRCVGPQLAEEPGAEVLVVGGDGGSNSIGLYAAGLAITLGAARVVYLDDDADRLAVAETFGAQVIDGPPRRIGSFPITVDAAGSEAGLRCAIESTSRDGTCTSAAVYLNDPSLPLLGMYTRCCTFHTGRAHARAALPGVLDAVAAGFDPSLVTSTVADWDDAVDALADPPMKLVLSRAA
ncbi:MAG: alcohol dehydrogenase catalytic domain-containing protein [Actinomycetota bacterium]|nr:alcohol dehydrogenase catalytic domain-containing protein [Actinomycetota bacterium]